MRCCSAADTAACSHHVLHARRALASIGPGNIATAALMAPMAMAAAATPRIPGFLMAIMVGNGANAGSLSPFAPTGIIVNGLMARTGLAGLRATDIPLQLRRPRSSPSPAISSSGAGSSSGVTGAPRTRGGRATNGAFEAHHVMTLAVIALLIL